jgi:hypothetical protein
MRAGIRIEGVIGKFIAQLHLPRWLITHSTILSSVAFIHPNLAKVVLGKLHDFYSSGVVKFETRLPINNGAKIE